MQNTLKDVALPVHLLRQVPKLMLFRHFSHLFLDVAFVSFLNRFWRGFGRVLEATIEPKSMQNQKKVEKRHAENRC